MDDRLIKRMDILDRRLKEIGEIQRDILKVKIATAVIDYSKLGIGLESSPYARDLKRGNMNSFYGFDELAKK